MKDKSANANTCGRGSGSRKDQRDCVCKHGYKCSRVAYTDTYKSLRSVCSVQVDISNLLMPVDPSTRPITFPFTLAGFFDDSVTKALSRYCADDIKLLTARLLDNIECSSIRMNINGLC